MFSSLGLFRNVPCPRQDDCSLQTCIFSHSWRVPSPEADHGLNSAKEYDPFSAGEISSPPSKRRKLESPPQQPVISNVVRLDTRGLEVSTPASFGTQPPSPSRTVSRLTQEIPTSSQIPRHVIQGRAEGKPTSLVRPVSPPPTQFRNESSVLIKKQPVKVESLTPRNVANAPALLRTRLTVLQKLHEEMRTQNSKLADSDTKHRSLVLDEQELVRFALDEEEAATKLGGEIYKNTMAQNILRTRKMTMEEWVKRVSQWTGTSSSANVHAKLVDKRDDLLSAGLSSLNEQVAVLKHLHTPLEGLEKFGYVTTQPSSSELASAKAGLVATRGFESCDRCGTRFQVFPGRDETGRLTSQGRCRYHWARPNRTVPLKRDRTQGQSEAIYPCCNKPQGSEGCSDADSHVFVVKDPRRLATILQFEHTPAKSDIRLRQPVSFDCEMGYTTHGMEVIRVTAVSWPDGRLLLDVLVRPFGEILDLNTRFSGVTKEAYASALPYQATLCENVQEAHLNDRQLRKVDSPGAARQLLFEHISRETPLIGHAIENDLNVVRIIHPCVVDTALLYPHPRGLPIRYGLKLLSQKYLSRGIQTAGEAGHDSKEDAVATGDLVTKKVVEKWKLMRCEGWAFVDGTLMAPEEMKPLEHVP
ncbi:uncharacterized protein Z519_05737 [Cladophialophora bantiana CBS 173.52]|uniref:Exonuclease domain-containing protein n=1 Tax=Cladophialophora bantiana (strain ATCC 10958 / CBS 173.52 / CDC B-1940 / NIH 8579) TaxID=1442370 RepID=A0A0D2G375_CLAB1|nr:uncharacterized protein Z519_05737 [Cladophialophora bantiana CBS 173.52]KIW93132.1 hypothetical protein Z519_05737 [Cladophialophora bantiana CBS 173.52]